MELSRWELSAASAAQERDATVTPEQRRRAGIVHTPPLLARALVRQTHMALQRGGFEQGLCDPRVLVVDPACGPGAFVAALLALSAQVGHGPGRFFAMDIDRDACERVTEQFLAPSRALGCELVVACQDALRGGVDALPSADVMVVIGNPPWAVARAEPSEEMQRLLLDFKQDAQGQPLRERKLGVLSDSYVRFFRLALSIALRGRVAGALGLWTNASFIDGPVHRGMRRCLLAWLDELAVWDFGGSALLSRRGQEVDHNLFQVKPAVALTVGASTRGQHAGAATLRYEKITGPRNGKQRVLENLAQGHPVPQRGRRPVPVAPHYRFRAAPPGFAEYAAGIGLHEAMPFHREGVQTNRDRHVISAEVGALQQRIQALLAGRAEQFPADSPHFSRDVAAAALRRAVDGAGNDPRAIVRPIAYRPFDTRHFIAVAPLCHRPRPELLAAMDRSPYALVSVRKDRGHAPYRHIGAVQHVPDSSYLSARSSCRTRAFPLCTPDGEPNFDSGLAAILGERLQRRIAIQDFAAYALAVLSSPGYRARFDELLRQDYARVPWPTCAHGFFEWATQGRQLIACLFTAQPADLADLQEAAAIPYGVGHYSLHLRASSGLAKAVTALDR